MYTNVCDVDLSIFVRSLKYNILITYVNFRNYTRQTSETTVNREAAGFVNRAVKRYILKVLYL